MNVKLAIGMDGRLTGMAIRWTVNSELGDIYCGRE